MTISENNRSEKQDMAEGALYVIASPIGNRQDISLRALEVLRDVDLVAAEDTRHSRPLLAHFQITTPLISLHAHNESERIESLISRIRSGEKIGLISDAGTPLISDPGFRLVTAVQAAGLTVIPIPGACALITALSAAGLPADQFIFDGFLPARASARRACFESLKQESRTLVFYESPHRIVACIDDMVTVFGSERVVVLARELTKMYETIKRAPLAELQQWLKDDSNQQRGEFVVLVAGEQRAEKQELSAQDLHVLSLLSEELPLKQAVALAAKITGKNKNQLYRAALDLEQNK